MRILIVSDLHANPWALRAVEEDAGRFDHVLCAGDHVSYGPDPAGALAWVRRHQAIGVRGNHDHAVATGADPKASPAKQPMALAMRDWTRAELEDEDAAFLVRLPLQLLWEVGGARIAVTHATPLDALYDYRLKPDAPDAFVNEATATTKADFLVLGHTHLPLARAARGLTVVNPGSVGQPLDGDPRAAYAIWEDGRIELRRAAYDPAPLVAALERLPIDAPLRADLVRMARTARLG